MSDSPDQPTPSAAQSGQGASSALEQMRLRQAAPLVPEVLSATAGQADAGVSVLIPSLLATVKTTLGMEVAFVSNFINGRRVFKFVDTPQDAQVIAVGDSDRLEASWCLKIVDGRLPSFLPDAEVAMGSGVMDRPAFPIGTHLSVPITRRDGSTIGTVCCFSFAKSPDASEADLELLRSVAALISADEHRREVGHGG